MALYKQRTDEERHSRKRAALEVIEGEINQLAREGVWGELPLVLTLRDGVCATLRATGFERTYPLDRLPHAA